jgi:hypothetical protein
MMPNHPDAFEPRNGEMGCRQNQTSPAMGRGSCACGNHHHDHEHSPENRCAHNSQGRERNTACHTLMDQIRAVDFALYETVLYLDVYPHSCDALETYHKLKAQSHALHEEYESVCGPLTAFGNRSTASWDWMSKPCPWEYDAD